MYGILVEKLVESCAPGIRKVAPGLLWLLPNHEGRTL